MIKQNEISYTFQKPFFCTLFKSHITRRHTQSVIEIWQPDWNIAASICWSTVLWGKNSQVETPKWHKLIHRNDNLLVLFPLDRHAHSADCKHFSPFKKEFKMKSALLIICLKLQFWAGEQCLYNISQGIVSLKNVPYSVFIREEFLDTTELHLIKLNRLQPV